MNMNGIICVNKPEGYTSFDVVAVARKFLHTRRIGHGGTLDPMATGVLPLFVGNATKAVDFAPDNDKEYVAGFRFGLTTDTEDITGKVLTTSNEYISRNKMIFIERIKGELQQIPPMFSAVQVNGERLYDIARRGEEVERKARTVTIHSIKIEEYRDNCGIMRVSCSKGTYIRTLIHDIGQQFGCGAVLTSLVRTKSGPFTLDMCHELTNLVEAAGDPQRGSIYLNTLLMPLSALFKDYPKAYLTEQQSVLFSNGVVLAADRIRFERVYDGIYAVHNADNRLVALAKIAPDHEFAVLQRFAPERESAGEL